MLYQVIVESPFGASRVDIVASYSRACYLARFARTMGNVASIRVWSLTIATVTA